MVVIETFTGPYQRGMNLRTPERFEKPKADSSYLKCFFFTISRHVSPSISIFLWVSQLFLGNAMGNPHFFSGPRWSSKRRREIPSVQRLRFSSVTGGFFFQKTKNDWGNSIHFFDIFLGIWCFIFFFEPITGSKSCNDWPPPTICQCSDVALQHMISSGREAIQAWRYGN